MVLVPAVLFMTSTFSVPSPLQAEALLKTCRRPGRQPSFPCCPVDILRHRLRPRLRPGLGCSPLPPQSSSPGICLHHRLGHFSYVGPLLFGSTIKILLGLHCCLRGVHPPAVPGNGALEGSVLRPPACSQRAISHEARITCLVVEF